jgi:hypothetical protein
MSELIEQKGKPCCINMISDDDKKFLAALEKKAAKEARAKARAEAAAKAAEEGEKSGEATEKDEETKVTEQIESEDEIDEVDLLIQKEQQDHDKKREETEGLIKKKLAEENSKLM